MQYAASLTAIGVLTLSIMAAMAAQWSSPQPMLNQPVWPVDVPLMLRLQESRSPSNAPKAQGAEFKTSQHRHHAQCDHELRSPGKPGADVTLASAGIRMLPLGNARDLELKLQSQLPRGTLRVRLEPSEDLALLSAVQEWQFDVNGEQTLVLPVVLQALAEGQHYVHLFIEHEDADGTGTARALATEFRTGTFITNVYAKSFSASSQREFSTLPANEQIY